MQCHLLPLYTYNDTFLLVGAIVLCIIPAPSTAVFDGKKVPKDERLRAFQIGPRASSSIPSARVPDLELCSWSLAAIPYLLLFVIDIKDRLTVTESYDSNCPTAYLTTPFLVELLGGMSCGLPKTAMISHAHMMYTSPWRLLYRITF